MPGCATRRFRWSTNVTRRSGRWQSSLDKLSNLDLVAQIEDKVGDDLQYIRLNGAIVGGLVGAIITTVRVLI